MSSIWREISFLLRTRIGWPSVLALAVLSSVALGFGLHEVKRQNEAIDRMVALQAADTLAVMKFATDPGDAAYYTFYPTYSRPSSLAFAALGQRDVAPFMLRIRALALEGQIYDNDITNPQIALVGRFDFAFVIIYLMPLFLIGLFHDLWSGERVAGRANLLNAIPRAGWRVWGARIGARAALVLSAVGVPFGIGSLVSGAPALLALQFLSYVAVFIALWAIVCVIVARTLVSPSVHAAGLCAIWLVVTLIAPSGANFVVNAQVPLPQGADIARANREAVHSAWDQPRQAKLDAFTALYPRWQTDPMQKPFEWKWYYAFQHLGDLAVAKQSQAFCEGILKREQLADDLGWVLPPAGIQSSLLRLAKTDSAAQLDYLVQVRAYHAQVRAFYYPYLFGELPFTAADFNKAPKFEMASAPKADPCRF